jgi:hypothetical protein
MSAAEPTPPSGSSLLARLGWAAKDKLLGRGDEERASDPVKLVHSSDLHTWDRFPRCQDFEGITFGEYRAEAYQLERRRRTVAGLIAAIQELEQLDSDEIVEYDVEHVEVPRRGLLRHTARLPLPQTPRPGTSVETSAGSITEGVLEVETGWRRQWIRLSYRGASRRANAERIDELRHRLEAMTAEQRETIDEVTASRYAHPVLFISHRWENEAHPDPSGSQLQKLRALKDCFIVYDYSSFPQHPRSDQEEADFRTILGSMDELIRQVVILDAPDYLERGWCLYEYIVSSLHRTTVCDEVQDARFVTLRDWASTDPPVALSFRDSFESQQQNYLNERILGAVLNDVLPLYGEADFQYEADRAIVTELLLQHLVRTLPPTKESQAYVGEWKTNTWSVERLRPFLSGTEELPRFESDVGIRRFETSVPANVQEAVDRRYEIKRHGLLDLLNPLDDLRRASRRRE